MAADNVRYALLMLVAGLGIPVLAALNAQLGHRLASPAAAATVLFMVALGMALLTLLATAGLAPLARIAEPPKYLFLGGRIFGLLRAFGHLGGTTFRCGQCGILCFTRTTCISWFD